MNQPIPDLSNLINLNSLSLYGTQLTGTINLVYFPPNLTSISLGRNQLQGMIPDFSKFTNLYNLDLSNNQLTGFIPPDLSSLKLQHLNLSFNQFTGPILTFPTSLYSLYLNNNHLSGEIPLSLINLTGLCSKNINNDIWSGCFDLSYNHLNTTTTPEIHAFLEAPGNKDPDWALTQTFSLLTCPQGGSFSIKPDPQQLNFGTELVGQTTTLNINTRAQDCGDFKLKGIQFVGDSKNEFALQSDPQQNCYDSNESGHHYSACQLTIAFSPQSAGTKTDISLQFVFEPALDTTPISIQANAIDSGAPVIKVTPTEHAFGEINLGSTPNPQVFTLTNAGNISLKSPTFELTGANPLEFTFAGWGCNYKNVLLPNEQESCELMAQFIPITADDKQADLTIQSANPAFKVPLTGTAKIPESCANITTESVNSGDWNDPATWSTNAIPREFDNVRLNAGHTIRGANSATVNALCIADSGVLESPDNQGTQMVLHAMSYLENKGIIRGQNGADQLATATNCNGDYWSTIGTPDCAQPGASLILSVGHNPENLLNNEGVIIAGRGGSGQLHHAYGGNVSLLGNVIVNHITDTGCGIIKAGDGSLAIPASATERPGVPPQCIELLNQLTDAANDGDTATPADNGRAGKGGDLTLWANSGLYSQGPVQVLAGNGGNCTAAQTQGGNGGRLRFNARQRVDLSGGYFAAGRGSTNCQQNGNSGAVGIEPSVISLAGAGTRIEGGDITIFGGDDWVLDLSHLDAAAIQADGNITLAVGKDGIIDLRGNSAAILKAGGQVKLFSDEVLLDGNVNLKQVIQAKDVVVGPNKILYDVSFLGADKFAAQPGSGLTIPLTLANNGPTVDTYTLTLTNPQGWVISELPATLEVKELSTHELPLQVTVPETRGASNSITVTATSQADSTVTATANILVTVAMESAVVNPEPEPVATNPEPITVEPELVTLPLTVTVPMPTNNPCPDSGTINWLCDNRERTLTNATVAENASIAGGYLAGEIDNQGLISQVTIQPETTLTGGHLTGTIINQGTLANFNFVGARVVGGILAGQITNTSQIEGYFQDVHLADHTQITGGQLAGQISGEAQAPAVLKQLAIKPGSRLEHVIISDAVTFAADVTFGEGVQFQNPSQDPRLISSPGEEPTPPATVTCDPELPALEVTATNSKGKTIEMTAQAAGGAAVNGGSFKPTVSVQLTDTVEVRGTLCVEVSKIGQSAEIVVYAHYQPLDSTQASAHYMLDSEGQVQLWDGKWEHLVALKSTILESKQSVTLYQGVFPVTGEVALSFGYRLADGTIVANTKMIVVKIAP